MKKKSATPIDGHVASKKKSKPVPILGDFFWMRDDANELIIEIMEKKELTERYMYSFMNLEQLSTYAELIWSIVYLSLFSFFFKWSEVYVWVIPAVLATSSLFVLATLGISIYRHGKIQSVARRNKEFSKRYLEGNTGGIVWLAWCIYSVVIEKLPPDVRLPNTASYLIGTVAFLLVLLSYKNTLLQGTWKWMSATLALSLLLLLIPHEDSVNFQLDGLIYFAKLTGFFCIYIGTEFELQLADLIETGVQPRPSVTEDKNDDPEYTHRYLFRLKRSELIVLRISWILFCPKYLSVLAFIQFYPLWRQSNFYFSVYKTLHHTVRQKDPTLARAFANDDDTQFRRDAKHKEKRRMPEELPEPKKHAPLPSSSSKLKHKSEKSSSTSKSKKKSVPSSDEERSSSSDSSSEAPVVKMPGKIKPKAHKSKPSKEIVSVGALPLKKKPSATPHRHTPLWANNNNSVPIIEGKKNIIPIVTNVPTFLEPKQRVIAQPKAESSEEDDDFENFAPLNNPEEEKAVDRNEFPVLDTALNEYTLIKDDTPGSGVEKDHKE